MNTHAWLRRLDTLSELTQCKLKWTRQKYTPQVTHVHYASASNFNSVLYAKVYIALHKKKYIPNNSKTEITELYRAWYVFHLIPHNVHSITFTFPHFPPFRNLRSKRDSPATPISGQERNNEQTKFLFKKRANFTDYDREGLRELQEQKHRVNTIHSWLFFSWIRSKQSVTLQSKLRPIAAKRKVFTPGLTMKYLIYPSWCFS